MTAPWTTNCLACRVLLANKARKIAVSSLLSNGANVICVNGVSCSEGLPFCSRSPSRSLSISQVLCNPEPRPAETFDPSSWANRLASMGTTLRMRRENMRSHCVSGTCSPWYARAADLAVHFCWKKVLLLVPGLRKRCRLYKLYLLHDCRIFCLALALNDGTWSNKTNAIDTYRPAQRSRSPVSHDGESGEHWCLSAVPPSVYRTVGQISQSRVSPDTYLNIQAEFKHIPIGCCLSLSTSACTDPTPSYINLVSPPPF